MGQELGEEKQFKGHRHACIEQWVGEQDASIRHNVLVLNLWFVLISPQRHYAWDKSRYENKSK